MCNNLREILLDMDIKLHHFVASYKIIGKNFLSPDIEFSKTFY